METLPFDHQALRTIFEKSGLRCTAQRLAVYDHLEHELGHPTVEEVYRSVRTTIPRISLATVYKALEALVAVGAATKLAAGSGATRSRYDARRDLHYHFRCLRTGAVHDLPTRFDPDLIAKIDPHLADYLSRQGFQVTGYRLELLGYQDIASGCHSSPSPPEGPAGLPPSSTGDIGTAAASS
jgi:Fe2+ or Zn2+ uptake regulation protein